jgi:hypothetical protein
LNPSQSVSIAATPIDLRARHVVDFPEPETPVTQTSRTDKASHPIDLVALGYE